MGYIRGLVIAATTLVAAATASAGPFGYWTTPTGDQPASYSPFNYLTPEAVRLHEKHCGPHLSVYAPDRHPEIPATVTILKYCHPAAEPGATIIEPPTPPATSQFRY